MSDSDPLPPPSKLPSLNPRTATGRSTWLIMALLVGAGEMRAQISNLQAEIYQVNLRLSAIEHRLTDK